MGLFSSIGKFLFGGSKKTSEQKATSTGTTDVDPYAPVIPFINQYITDTDALYRTQPMFSDMETAGYGALTDTVNAPSPVTAAVNYNNDVLGGKYLDVANNPYLKDIATRVSGIAGANQNATFGGRGRSSGGLAAYYGGKAVADSANELYGSQYEAERGRMTTAASLAPTLDSARYLGPQALISAGQNISARPYDINQQYGGILANIGRLGQQGTTTGSSTQTNYQQNPGLIGGIVNSFSNKLFGNNVNPW